MRISDWSSDVCSSDLQHAWFDRSCCLEAYLPQRCVPTLRTLFGKSRTATSLTPGSGCSGTKTSASGLIAPTCGVALQAYSARRSEERRVGKECVRPCSFRWAPEPAKKNIVTNR